MRPDLPAPLTFRHRRSSVGMTPGPASAAGSEQWPEGVEHGGVLDGAGHRGHLAVSELPHRFAQDLPRARLGQARHDIDLAQAGDRADLVADALYQFGPDAVALGRGIHPALEHDEP